MGATGYAAVDYMMAIIGDDEGSHRQGDDHTDHAEDSSPYAETEQDSGRTHTRHVSHNLRRQHEVLNTLHHDEDERHEEQGHPNGLPRLRGLDEA